MGNNHSLGTYSATSSLSGETDVENNNSVQEVKKRAERALEESGWCNIFFSLERQKERGIAVSLNCTLEEQCHSSSATES